MGSGESKDVPRQSGNGSTFTCNGTLVSGNFSTVIGNYNRVQGNNIKVYGHYNLVEGNFNSSYGTHNKMSGNFCGMKKSDPKRTPDEKKLRQCPWNAPKNVPLSNLGREREKHVGDGDSDKSSTSSTEVEDHSLPPPPPPTSEWITCSTKSGKKYYYNQQKGLTSWTVPNDHKEPTSDVPIVTNAVLVVERDETLDPNGTKPTAPPAE